jgi:acyl-CoA reductase-like NAD-dependent aldehyde dehydrogenase
MNTHTFYEYVCIYNQNFKRGDEMLTKMLTEGLYLSGEYVKSQTTYELFNPHTGEKITDVALATTEEMEKAISHAQKGFEKMRELPAHRRAEILYKVAELLKEKQEEFAQIICLEAAKPISAARGEVGRGIQALTFAAEEAKRLTGEYISLEAAPGGEGRYAFTTYEPIGIVGAITPFNFPLNLVIHKLGPSFAAGNSIIIKPAEQTPLTSLKLAELFKEAGAPDGAVNVVPGEGPSLGKVLLNDERIKKISFTGSPEVGKLIKSQAGLKKVTLELGSNSAMYVSKSVKSVLNTVAKKAVVGAFAYSGQVCISTQRVYVDKEVFEEFSTYLVDETKKIVVGNPLDESTMVTSLINKRAQERIVSWIDEAKIKGAVVLVGGDVQENTVFPTVITNVDNTMNVSCSEIFGPVLIVQPVENSEEALALINDSRYGLNAGVFSNDLQEAMKMAKQIEVGQVLINDVPTLRFDHMPYAGLKESGYGKEGIKYAIQEMTDLKMISINYNL